MPRCTKEGEVFSFFVLFVRSFGYESSNFLEHLFGYAFNFRHKTKTCQAFPKKSGGIFFRFYQICYIFSLTPKNRTLVKTAGYIKKPQRKTEAAKNILKTFQLFSIRQTAWAAIPSPFPVKPSPSSVVAFTLTAETESEHARAIFFLISSMCGLSFGA